MQLRLSYDIQSVNVWLIALPIRNLIVHTSYITCKIRYKLSSFAKWCINHIQDIVIQFIAFDSRGDLVGNEKKRKEAKEKQSAEKAKLAKVEEGGGGRGRGEGEKPRKGKPR